MHIPTCRVRIADTPALLVIEERPLHDYVVSQARVELAQVRERVKQMS